MNIKPKSRKANIVLQELEGEVLIYDLIINKALCLNETSALVYQLCDGAKTVSEIRHLMSKKLQTWVSEDFVRLALNELKKEKLLEDGDEIGDFLAGMSRREMVKKVGLGSMVALPIVSSIVAPNAAMAQSNLLPLFAACASSPQCMSGNCFPSVAFGQVCCASNTMTEGFASGFLLNCVINPAFCTASRCCSGQTETFVDTAACNPGEVRCRCL